MSSSKLKSYYNLTKPGIVYGNLLTAIAGFLFASHWHINLRLFISMNVGLGLIIGSSCVLNNVLDKNIDRKMERTKKRATATGDIPTKSALIYASTLGLIGVVILGTLTNILTLMVALFGIAVYVIFYGLAKRRTVYGTLVGSLAGAVPPLVGYTSYTNYIDLAGILLVFILICWQLTHFYGIALYRKKDYQNAKLPVWPVVKGDWNTQVQAIASIVLFTLFAIGLFLIGACGFTYLAIVLLLGIGWLWYALFTAGKLRAEAWGKKIFISSMTVMLILCVALALGPVLP